MAEGQANEALEKLNRGIEESKQMVQQQTMGLAQDFFADSVEQMKGQIQESRATLENLPEQVPGGQDEAFQMLFQELMDNYSAIEEVLDEAKQNVSNLDTEALAKQGEVEATDAARREAKERGVDLTQVEPTGSGGRITVVDVVEFAESQQGDDEKEIHISDAARRQAEELGLDLSEIEGTGVGGMITVKDVTGMAEDAAGDADGTVQDAAEAVQGAAGNGSGEVNATNAAQRKAEEMGVDLSQIEGSGAGGLITIRDVVKG